MQSVIPPGDPDNTIIAGKSQGFLGLAINFGMIEMNMGEFIELALAMKFTLSETRDTNFPDKLFPTMTTAYIPTPDELERINAGAPILFQQLGRPPILPQLAYVGEVPPHD